MKRIALLAVLCLAALAACGSKEAVPVTDTTPAAATASASTPAGPDIAGFILALRMKHPRLTEGRTDKALRNDALNTCASLRAGETKAVINRQVTARFGSHDGNAPTRAEVTSILALLAEHGCPPKSDAP